MNAIRVTQSNPYNVEWLLLFLLSSPRFFCCIHYIVGNSIHPKLLDDFLGNWNFLSLHATLLCSCWLQLQTDAVDPITKMRLIECISIREDFVSSILVLHVFRHSFVQIRCTTATQHIAKQWTLSKGSNEPRSIFHSAFLPFGTFLLFFYACTWFIISWIKISEFLLLFFIFIVCIRFRWIQMLLNLISKGIIFYFLCYYSCVLNRIWYRFRCAIGKVAIYFTHFVRFFWHFIYLVSQAIK